MTQHLQILFAKLNKSRIRYFLLTDFECDLESKDVDLFVHPHSKAAFEETLLESGWYKRKEPSHHANHHFYFSSHTEQYLDVKYELSFANGISDCYTYLNSEQALENAVLNKKGIHRPTGIDAILLYTAHLGYKERGRLEARHREYLLLYLDIYKAELSENTAGVVAAIQEWLAGSFPAESAKLQSILSPYFKHSHKRMTGSKNYLRYGYGMTVLFLGTDGAGKTTLLEAVEKKLSLKTSKLYLGMGEDGWTRPWVKNMYNHRFGVKVADQLFSALKSYIVLPVELLVRQIPVKLRSRYSIVLIDRVPGANLIEKKTGKSILYRSILPKPDLVFFLYADPQVLMKRKPQENTLERSKADLIKFRKVAETVSSGNYISIDTSGLTIDEARDLILSEIYKSHKVYDNLLTAKFY
jgi:thymidylate kinase